MDGVGGLADSYKVAGFGLTFVCLFRLGQLGLKLTDKEGTSELLNCLSFFVGRRWIFHLY